MTTSRSQHSRGGCLVCYGPSMIAIGHIKCTRFVSAPRLRFHTTPGLPPRWTPTEATASALELAPARAFELAPGQIGSTKGHQLGANSGAPTETPARTKSGGKSEGQLEATIGGHVGGTGGGICSTRLHRGLKPGARCRPVKRTHSHVGKCQPWRTPPSS